MQIKRKIQNLRIVSQIFQCKFQTELNNYQKSFNWSSFQIKLWIEIFVGESPSNNKTVANFVVRAIPRNEISYNVDNVPTDKLVQECWKLIHERGYVEIAPTTFQKNRKLLPDGRRSLDGFYLGIYVSLI